MFYVSVKSVILWEIVNLLRHVNISGYQIPLWCPITSISCSKLQRDHDVSDSSLWMRETAEGVGRIRVSWDSILHLPLCSFSLLPSSPGPEQQKIPPCRTGRVWASIPSHHSQVWQSEAVTGSRFPRSYHRGPSLQFLVSCLFLVTSEMSRVLPGNTSVSTLRKHGLHPSGLRSCPAVHS